MTNDQDLETRARDCQLQARLAIESGSEALEEVRAVLTRAMRELDRYSERYEEYTDLGDKAKVLNWTINFLTTGILGNCRIDLLADAQVSLSKGALELRMWER